MRATGIMGAMLLTRDICRAADHLLTPVLNRLALQDPLTAMESLVSDLTEGRPVGGKGEDLFNAYPSGRSEDVCKPFFLGICRGMDLLEDVLDAMGTWAKEADSSYPSAKDKIALLLTDKWNDAFEAYEQTFRYLAMNKGFFFLILLGTRGGISEIPFLPVELFSFTRQKE